MPIAFAEGDVEANRGEIDMRRSLPSSSRAANYQGMITRALLLMYP